jgi:hypothetical protein
MNVRHAWNWAKIKADPKKPFFAQRSTRNTPHTAVILLRNAEIPMPQNKPPVFAPETSEQGTIRKKIAIEYFSPTIRLIDCLWLTTPSSLLCSMC